DGPRADEEAPPQRHPERRLRARVDRADTLPGALDAAPHGAVEDPAAGDLEQAEPRLVEDPREPEDGRRRHPPRERLLPEQPDRRVDELGHRRDPSARQLQRRLAARTTSI